jgi:hypothetical protein
VALLATTVSIDELPEMIEAGFAVMEMVGAVGGTTVMVTVALAVPPAPVAVAV